MIAPISKLKTGPAKKQTAKKSLKKPAKMTARKPKK
jgi:hypothetical protein